MITYYIKTIHDIRSPYAIFMKRRGFADMELERFADTDQMHKWVVGNHIKLSK
jgi:hypothetical protein